MRNKRIMQTTIASASGEARAATEIATAVLGRPAAWNIQAVADRESMSASAAMAATTGNQGFQGSNCPPGPNEPVEHQTTKSIGTIAVACRAVKRMSVISSVLLGCVLFTMRHLSWTTRLAALEGYPE